MALLFLPSEAVYAELYANFPNVVEESFRARVWIVSPTTMMALLNTVRAVLRDVEMRKEAGLIKIEVDRMLEDVAPAGRAGRQAGDAISSRRAAMSRRSASRPKASFAMAREFAPSSWARTRWS